MGWEAEQVEALLTWEETEAVEDDYIRGGECYVLRHDEYAFVLKHVYRHGRIHTMHNRYEPMALHTIAAPTTFTLEPVADQATYIQEKMHAPTTKIEPRTAAAEEQLLEDVTRIAAFLDTHGFDSRGFLTACMTNPDGRTRITDLGTDIGNPDTRRDTDQGLHTIQDAYPAAADTVETLYEQYRTQFTA